jgi:hypothetical protein
MRIAGTAVSILVFFLMAASALPALAQGPQLSLDNPDFQFGEILQGEKLEHVFTFHNTGNEDLVINGVRSSCGCTAALLSAEVIAPGGKGEVRAAFNSGNFRGAVEKSIYLTSNDPRLASATLHLRGKVLPVIEAPLDINLGVLKPGEPREVRVALSNRSKETVTLKSVESTVPAVRVAKAASALPPGGTGEILLRAEISGSEPMNGYLIIRTDSPRAPEMRLFLFGSPVPH